jgi:hypothetical protein
MGFVEDWRRLEGTYLVAYNTVQAMVETACSITAWVEPHPYPPTYGVLNRGMVARYYVRRLPTLIEEWERHRPARAVAHAAASAAHLAAAGMAGKVLAACK